MRRLAPNSRLLFAVCAVAMLASGCAPGDEGPGYVTIQLPQVSCPDNLALSGKDTCSFSVSIHNGPWRDSAPEQIFAAGCVPYSGDLITITGVTSGEGFTIKLDGYSDEACTEKALTGARGGVRIREGTEQDGIWFVPTFRTAGFSAFPEFAQGVRQVAAAAECSTDVDCRTRTSDGFTYEISPVASCDTTTNTCRMPETAYPLNMATARALHTATTIDDGRIVFVGGVAVSPQGGKFLGTDQVVEVFDPVSMTFATSSISLPSDLRVAGHATVSLGGSKLAFYGGARQIDAEVVAVGPEDGAKQFVRVTLPTNDVTQTDNVSDLAFTIDVNTGDLSSGTISQPRAFLSAINTPEGVLVAGGSQPVGAGGQGTVASAVAELCNGTTCEPLGAGLAAARWGHCAVCLDAPSGGACGNVALFGGIPTDQEDLATDALAEVYTGGALSSVGLLSSDLDSNVALPRCIRGGGNVYLVGGSQRTNRPPSIAAALLGLNSSGSKIGAEEIGKVTGITAPFRVHTASVELSDGRVLVTGGLDDNGTPVAKAYIIDGKEAVDQINMVTGRFGHTASLLTTGPLAGAVLIAGGFTVDSTGNISVVPGAELYVP